jgi:chromosome segregation ATPase
MRQTRKGVLIEDADVEIIEKLIKTASVKDGAITSAHEALTNAKARITRAREVLDTQDDIINQAHKDAQKIRTDAKNEVQQLNAKISSLNRQKAELEADTAEAQDVKEELKELKSKRDELAEDVNNNAYLLEELAEMSAHPDEIDATLTDKLIERITREAVTETIHALDDSGRLQTNTMDCQNQVFMQLPALTARIREKIQPLINKPVELVQDIINSYHHSR